MSACRKLLPVLIWGLAGALIPAGFLAVIGANARTIWQFSRYAIVYSFVIGSLAFFIVPYTWRRFPDRGFTLNWMLRLGILLVVALLGTLIAGVIFLELGMNKPGLFWTYFRNDARIAIFITLVSGIVISFVESMRAKLEETTLQLRTKELDRERALKLATEARLSSLESRIHPHFLFNTLNSISALIPEDPGRAERLIERMAALLRFSLDSSQNGLVPLDREMKIVNDYLEIEQTRFGGRLRFQLDIEPGLAEAMVPPLSVQTLVENSVKHAIAHNRAGGEISVTGARLNGVVKLSVSDSGPGFALESAPAGHGIDNLRGRLAALFGTSARLTSARNGVHSTVSLWIPQTDASLPH